MTRTYTKPAKAIYYSVLYLNLDIGELTCCISGDFLLRIYRLSQQTFLRSLYISTI